MPGLLIPISAGGSSAVDVDFDRLRRWLVDGLVPVVVVAGQNMVRAIDCGLSLRAAASVLGVPVETVAELLRAGALKPLPLPGGATRLRQADVEAWVRKLTSVGMTDALREAVWPSVEEYTADSSGLYPMPNPMASYEHRVALDNAAAARVEREFQTWLRENFPQPIVTAVEDGVDQVDMSVDVLSPQQIADQRHAWHKRRREAAEAERYDRALRRW